jgi:hypothetical protein
MDNTRYLQKDRVRKNTPGKLNQKIDDETNESIRLYARQGKAAIQSRLRELDEEWDTERTLELVSASVTLAGLGLSVLVNKKWALLSAVSAAFLAQHSIQGWCPPLPIIRALGVRTKNEIEKEKDALVKSLE